MVCCFVYCWTVLTRNLHVTKTCMQRKIANFCQLGYIQVISRFVVSSYCIRSSWSSRYLKMAMGLSSTKHQTWSRVLWRNLLFSDLELCVLNWQNHLVRGSLIFSCCYTSTLHHLLPVYGDTNSGQVFASSNRCVGNEEGKCVAWLLISQQLRLLSNFGGLMRWSYTCATKRTVVEGYRLT